MEWLSPVGIIVYLMIGVLIATICARDVGSSELELVAVLFWPVALIMILMFEVCSIPYKLANWIMDRKK